MATKLGDAVIRIRLDPGESRRELDSLSRRMEDVRRTRQREAQAVPEAPARPGIGGASGAAAGAALGGARKLINLLIAGAATKALTGFVPEKVFPTAGIITRELLEEILPFTGWGQAVEDRLTGGSQNLARIGAEISAALKSVKDVYDVGSAQLRLGGRIDASEAANIIGILNRINEKESEFDSMVRRTVGRDMAQNLMDQAQGAFQR